jgi:hypothetical protein
MSMTNTLGGGGGGGGVKCHFLNIMIKCANMWIVRG